MLLETLAISGSLVGSTPSPIRDVEAELTPAGYLALYIDTNPTEILAAQLSTRLKYDEVGGPVAPRRAAPSRFQSIEEVGSTIVLETRVSAREIAGTKWPAYTAEVWFEYRGEIFDYKIPLVLHMQ